MKRADINNELGEYRKEDVVYEQLLIFVKYMYSLNGTINEHLQTHLKPINVHKQEAE